VARNPRTCASLLVALDVHPRVAMRILRQGKIAVTMEIYTAVPDDTTATRCAASVTSSMASCCTLLLHEDQKASRKIATGF
jgi:hypothetical protein